MKNWIGIFCVFIHLCIYSTYINFDTHLKMVHSQLNGLGLENDRFPIQLPLQQKVHFGIRG